MIDILNGQTLRGRIRHQRRFVQRFGFDDPCAGARRPDIRQMRLSRSGGSVKRRRRRRPSGIGVDKTDGRAVAGSDDEILACEIAARFEWQR